MPNTPTIAQRLRSLYDNLVIANNTTNEFVEALPDCYDAVEAKGGTLPAQETAANLPAAIASIPSGGGMSLEDVYLITGTNIDQQTCAAISPTDTITLFDVENFTLPHLEMVLANTYEIFCGNQTRYTHIKEMHFPELTIISAYEFGKNFANLELLDAPKLTSIARYYNFRFNNKLKKAYIPLIQTIEFRTFDSCPNLIDLTLGSAFTGNVNISRWSPTNALSSSSSSLVEQGETFANNLEKFLYCVREHIAANLDQNITGKTITFSSAVYNAIHADAATEAAFGNWSIASA